MPEKRQILPKRKIVAFSDIFAKLLSAQLYSRNGAAALHLRNLTHMYTIYIQK